MDVYLARQPIFNGKQEIVAYELLYRSASSAQQAVIQDSNMSSIEVISNAFYAIGLAQLTRGKPAFVNISEELLQEDLSQLLSPDQVVLELLETISFTPSVVKECQRLKELGFTLALDDCEDRPDLDAVLPFVDIIKVDFRLTSIKNQKRFMERIQSADVLWLGEKIETQEEFELAKSIGYSYFQGFFFQKPVTITAKDLQVNPLSLIRLWEALYDVPMDFAKVESLVKEDVALSIKLLKLVNSALFGFRKEISSVKHALVILGEKEIRKWLTVLALRMKTSQRPDELLISALVRAKFAETLVPEYLGYPATDGFFLGLLSLIEALFGQPMKEALAPLPISNTVKEALLGKPCTLLDVVEVIASIEKGNWETMLAISKKLKISGEVLQQAYFDALMDSQEIYGLVE